MKRSRFTEEEIIAALREHEAGARTAPQARDLRGDALQLEGQIRRHGRPLAKCLTALKEENARLGTPLADWMLEVSALRELLLKESGEPAARREAVAHLILDIEHAR